MVIRRIAIAFLMGLLSASSLLASETGAYSYRAQRLLLNGQYHDAMRMLGTGLKRSAKEADLQGESRIYMGMAHIQFHNYEYTAAQDLLNQARDSELNAAGKLSKLRLSMQMANHQGQYTEASALFQAAEKLLKKDDLPEVAHAQVLLEFCVAQAGLGQSCSDSQLEEAEDLLDDESPGILAYAKARVADLGKHTEKAQKYYRTALEQAQKRQHSWEAGQILLRLGQIALAENAKDSAADYLLRASKLYDQLQLDRPFVQAAEAYLALGDDRDIGMAVAAAKARLSDK